MIFSCSQCTQELSQEYDDTTVGSNVADNKEICYTSFRTAETSHAVMSFNNEPVTVQVSYVEGRCSSKTCEHSTVELPENIQCTCHQMRSNFTVDLPDRKNSIIVYDSHCEAFFDEFL